MMQGLFSDAHEQQTAFSGVGDSSAVIHHQQQLQQHSLPHSVPHSLPHNKQHLPPLNQPALPLDLVSVSSSTHSLSDPDHQSSPSPAAGRTTTLNTAGCNGLNHLLHPHTHYDVNSIYASFNPYVTTSQLLQGSSILSSQQQQQQQVVNGHPSASSNRLGVHSSSSTSSLPPVVSHRRPPPPPENNLHTTHAASTSSSFHHPLPSMFESNHQLLQLQGRSCAPFMNNTQSNSKEKHTTLDSLGNMMPLQVLNFTPFNTQETHSTQQFKSTSGHQPKSHQLFSSQSLLHQQESFSGLPSTSGGSDVGHSHHQNKRTSSSSSSQQSYCHRPKCSYCASMIIDEECTEAEGGVYHIKCFSCTSCKTPLGGLQYIMHPNTTTTCDSQDNLSTVTRSPYCTSCFDSLFGEYCEGCGELIHVAKGSAISHEGRSWHALDKCFKCYFCKKSLLGLPFLPHSSGFIFCSVTCSKDAFALHNKSRSNATGNNNSRSTTSSSHIHEQKQQLESFPEESDQSHQQETSFSESPADSAHGSLSSSSSSQLNQRQQTLPGESCDQNQQQEASSPGPTLDPLQELLSSSSLHQQQQQLQTSSSSEESDQSPQQETLLSESPTDPLYASLLPSTSPPLLQDKHLKEDFSCNQREEEEETSFSATDHPLHGSLSTSKEDHDRDQDHHHHQRQVDQQQLEQNNSHDKRDTTNNTTSTATSKYSSVDGDDDARKNNKTASKKILQSKGCSSDADAGDDLGNDARKENSIRETSCDTIPSNESSLKPAVKSVSFDPETMKEKEGPSFVRRLRKSHSSSAHSSCSSPSKGSHSKRSSSRHHRRQGKKVCSCSTSSSSSHHHHHRSHDRSHHHHHHRRRSSTDRDHSQRRKRRDRQEYNDSQEEEERDCYESDASCSSCSSFSSSSSSCSTCSSSSSSYSSDSDDASNNDSRQIPSSQGLKEIKTTATGINSQTIVQSRELLFRSSSEVQKKNQIPKIKTIDLSSSSSLSSCVIS